jgi:hypothetical protein
MSKANTYNPAKRYERISHFVYGALLEDWTEEAIYQGILKHFPESAPAKRLTSFGSAMAWYRNQFKSMQIGRGDIDAFVTDQIVLGASDAAITNELKKRFPEVENMNIQTFRDQLRSRLMSQPGLERERLIKPIRNAMKITSSKRYVDKYWSYWWDLHDGDRQRFLEGQSIQFMRKDDRRKAIVTPEELLPHLIEDARTSRGKGNWGIRTLRDQPDVLRVEIMGTPHEDWPAIPVDWISEL